MRINPKSLFDLKEINFFMITEKTVQEFELTDLGLIIVYKEYDYDVIQLVDILNTDPLKNQRIVRRNLLERPYAQEYTESQDLH